MKIRLTTYNLLLACSFLALAFLLTHYLFVGITTLPSEGDSINIHIPIAQRILSGKILLPLNHNIDSMYPAASELILALFIGLHFSLNLYNVLAIVLLFFTLVALGRTFTLSKPMSIFFAISITTLYGVLRYVDTQKIDVWMLVFYALSLLLLKKSKKGIRDFFLLGITLGMVIGSKYSGPFYAIILLCFYLKDLVKQLNVYKFFIFFIPLCILGATWYIRNYSNFGNPFYPQPFLFFTGDPHALYYAWPYWKVALMFPQLVVNAFISEYMIWVVTLVILPIVLFGNVLFKKFPEINSEKRILFLGIINFIFFIFLPSAPAHDYTAIVYGIRYSFPAFLVLQLSLFCIAKKYNLDKLLAIVVFTNLIFLLLPVNYHAKLLFLFVPIITILILFTFRYFKIVEDK